MRVLKFGGSSVASAERLRDAAAIIDRAAGKDSVAVVVSALGGATDTLLQLLALAERGEPWADCFNDMAARHRQVLDALEEPAPAVRREVEGWLGELATLLDGVSLLGECPKRTRHRILATGERLSAPLLAAHLEALGRQAQVVDGRELIVVPAGAAEGGELVAASRDRARCRLAELDSATIPVITGFVAADDNGRTVTMSRGGSDLSATVLAAVLDAEAVEIWTDVDGVLSAPPRLVRGARTVAVLSSAEAAELAFFGAKVLHSRCLAAVAGRDIPVEIRNTLRPEGPITVVREAVPLRGVRALAAVERVSVRELAGADLAPCAAAAAARALMITGSSVSGRWQLVLPADAAVDGLADLGVPVAVDAALIALVGGDAVRQPWPLGRALETLARAGVEIHGVAAAAGSCSAAILVPREQLATALEMIHDALMLERRAEQEATRCVA